MSFLPQNGQIGSQALKGDNEPLHLSYCNTATYLDGPILAQVLQYG